ncbi:gag-pol polyprotein [Tanacetum coccineum]
MAPPLWKKRQVLLQQTEMQMYKEVERMYRYQPGNSLLIHHGGSFRKFPNHEYRGGKTDMFNFMDIDYFYVHELDAMVLQLGYDGVDKPMYYHYLRPMTDLDVEHGITKLNCYYTSNSQIRATIEEYHKDMGVEASSASPKKNLLLMLEWYDNSTPVKASSNTWSVTPKSIPRGLFIHACDETMILVGQISGVNSCVTKTSDLPRLSHDETFGTDGLDPPLPFDLNILAHVSTDEGIISDHANVQDRFDEELGYVNESDDVNHASVSEDNHHGNTTRVDEHLENDNALIENATSIGEDIHNHSDHQDSEYDADSSENEEANDYDEVMIDEENEIHKAEVEVHLFGLRDSYYHFTNIRVSSEVLDNVFMEKDGYEMDIDDFDTDSGGEGDCPGGKRSALNKLIKAYMEVEGDGSKYDFYCGQVFGSSKEVKDRVYLHSIETRRELKLVRNDKLRVRANCFGKTPVYSIASHGCENECFVGPYGSEGLNNRQRNKLSAEADAHVGGEINGKVNHGIPVKAVQDILQRELEVHISMGKAFRAKAKADKEIKGFLKQAVGIDANNGIYLVAYALVEAETENSWCWFLQCLGDDLDRQPNSNFTFISDRQRHIHENMKKGWRGKLFKECLWKCAAATTIVAFERCMNELKSLNVGAHD